jgi:mono/diheme cytochrome c family protein
MRDGRGVPGMNPPLVGSPWVVGSPEVLAGFVLSGGFGPDVLMAPFDYLGDAELAAILSYVRKQFGSGASPVGAELVAAARAQVSALKPQSSDAK